MVTNYLEPETEEYSIPEFNGVEVYDPPQVDPDDLRVVAQQDFTRRFSKFGGKRPPGWTAVKEALDQVEADPSTRFQTFKSWYEDYRDWHLAKGLLDQKGVAALQAKAYPYIRGFQLDIQKDVLNKQYQEDIGFLKEQYPGWYGEYLAASTEPTDFVSDVRNEFRRGMLQSLVAEEARNASRLAQFASDFSTNTDDPEFFNKLMSGDKSVLEKARAYYKNKEFLNNPKEVIPDSFKTLFGGVASDSYANSKLLEIDRIEGEIATNAFERVQRISNVAANLRKGQDIQEFEMAAQSNVTPLGTTIRQTIQAAPELFAQSIAQSKDVLAAAAIGSATGGAALSAIAAGLFSYDMDQAAEFSGLVQEEINRRAEERKIDPTDRKSLFDLSKEVFGDTAFITSAQETASKHAAPVAALDAAGAAIGSRAFRRFGRIGGAIGAAAADPVLGISGEVLGQQWAYGTIRDVAGAVAEGVGAPVSAVSALSGIYYWEPDTTTAPVQLTETPVVPTPEVKKTSLRDKIKAASKVEEVVEEVTPIDLLKQIEENPSIIYPETGKRAEEAADVIKRSSAAAAAETLSQTEPVPFTARQSAETLEEEATREERLRQSPLGAAALTADLRRQEVLKNILEDKNFAERFYPIISSLETDRVDLTPEQIDQYPLVKAKGKGMSVQESYRRNQGGFIDLEAIAQGISQAATSLYQTAKDFTEWSAGLVKQFGEKVQPFLKAIWEKIGYAVDFFTPIQGRPRMGGSIPNPIYQELEAAASTQRNIPESVMMDVSFKLQDIGAPALLVDLIEHIGDLSHRAQRENALINVDEKLRKVESFSGKGRLSLEDDFNQAIEGNAEYYVINNTPELKVLYDNIGKPDGPKRAYEVYELARKEYQPQIQERAKFIRQEIPKLLKEYVDAHKQHNKPITRLGKLGKIAAIQLGELKFNDLRTTVMFMREWLDDYKSLKTDKEKSDKFLEGYQPLKRTQKGSIINPFQSTERGKPESQVRNVISKKLKAVDAPKELRKLVKSFASRFLSPEDQKKMLKLADDYVAGKQGKTVGLPTESIMRGMQELKARADATEFEYLKQKNPQLLEGRTLESFGGAIRDVKGFLVKTPDAKGVRRPITAERRQELRSAKLNQLRNDVRVQFGNLNSYLDSDEYTELSATQQQQVDTALEAIVDVNLDDMDEPALRNLLEALNNLINDNDFIGIGKFATSRKAEGDKQNFVAAAGNDPDSMFGSPATSIEEPGMKFQSKIDRNVHMTEPAWRSWVKFFADYNFGRNNADFVYREKQKVLKREGDRIKNGESDYHLATTRMGIVATLAQWTDDRGVDYIIDTYHNIQKGIDNLLRARDTLSRVKGKLYQKAFAKFGNPFTYDEEGNPSYDGTVDELKDFFESQLTENERESYHAMLNEFEELKPDARFTKEFWVGEEFQEVNNYFPRQARQVATIKRGMESVDLEDSTSRYIDSETGKPIQSTEGTLKDRTGLASGQYYELNIFNLADRGFKQITYDIHTWPARSAMKKFLESNEMKELLGAERIESLSDAIKTVHLGYSGAGGLSDTVLGAMYEWFINTVIGRMLSSPVQFANQGIVPWTSALIAEFVFDGRPDISIQSASEYFTNGKQAKEWLAKASPEIYHRYEQENPVLDELKQSGKVASAINALQSLPFNELTSSEKALKVLFGARKAVTPFGYVPRRATRYVVQAPDALSARLIFMSQYIQQLIKRGIIQDFDGFSYELPIDPESSYEAKVITENYMNSPSSARERADMFNSPKHIEKMYSRIFSLAQSMLYSTGDRYTDFKSLALYKSNRESVETKAFRNEHKRKFLSSVMQSSLISIASLIWGKFLFSGIVVPLAKAIFHREYDDEDQEKEFKDTLDEIIANNRRVRTDPTEVAKELFLNVTKSTVPYTTNPLAGGAALNQTSGAFDMAMVEYFHKDAVDEINARLKDRRLTKEEREILEYEKAYHNFLIARKNTFLKSSVEAGQFSFSENTIDAVGTIKFTPSGIINQFLVSQSPDLAKMYRYIRKSEMKVERKEESKERRENIKEIAREIRKLPKAQ